MRNMIKRIAGGGARLLALLLAVGLSGSAWAATPVAAWTDFRNLTSGGYTWTVGGDSSVDPNTGVLTIGSTGGVYMDISGIGSDNRSFSIAIEAEIPGTYTSDKTLVDLIVNGSHVSVAANGTTIGQCWTTGALSGTAYGKSTFTAGRQLLTVTFQGASGQGTHSYIEGTQVAGHTGLMSSSGSVTHIGIGSYNKTGEVAEGLKIYSVRLYNSKISASDVSTDYDTYGVADYVTTVSSDTTLEGSDLTWVAKDGTTSTTAPAAYGKLDIRGSGTVTSSSAFNAIMNIGNGVVFKPASVGTTSVFTGGGSVVYSGVLPGTEKTCYTDSMFWNGTVWIENKTGITKFDPGTFGNANSTVKVSGIAGYFTDSNKTFNGTLEVSGTDSSGTAVSYGLSISDGYSANSYTIGKLTGDGLISDALNNKTATHLFIFNDASAFRGSISLTKGRRIQIGSGTSASDAMQVAVGAGSSVTIASGKTWQADGGIIVNGTLTLTDSSSTLTGTITGSGTIVSGGTVNVPNIASLTQSGWTGTVEVSGAASMQEMIDSSSTRFMNSGSTLKVTSGYAALTSVAGLTGKVSVNSGAALYVIDNTSTELAFALGTVEGQVNISGCSALTTLTLNVGADWAITTSKLQLPSSGTLATVNVVVGEKHGNGGSITLTNTTGLPAVDGRTYNYLVKREDGVTVSAALEGGVLTYAPTISGAAAMYDATFLNTTEFAYKKSSGANIGLDTALDPKYNNSLNDATTGIYIRHHPYVNGAASDIHGLTDFTLVVVGQMSPTQKTQFIHIGSTTGSNKGLLIATTENADEVIIAPNTGKTVDTSNAVTVSVPNAASARHAYVIIKSGSVFTVWVDGIKRGNFTVAEGWEIGASDHAGVQVGSDFGGEIQRSSDAGKYAAVDNSLEETGVVNVIRIFDYVISDAQAEAIVAAYPYISEGGLYTRTISADEYLSAADAWAKDGSATTYALPEGATVEEVYYAPSATVTVEADATLTVNAAVTIDTLTVGGVGDLAVASDGTHSITVSGAAVVNSPISITYGAVNLAGTPVQLGSGGTLHFDCSGIDLSEVSATTRYQLTGLMDRNDAKVTATLPTAVARTAALEYNSNGYYEIVVTTDHEAGSSVYYKSGYFGKNGTQAFSVVLADSTTQTRVFPGDTVVIDDKSSQNPIYVGALPDNVAAISIARTTRLASGDKDNEMLDGATVTVAEGGALTIYRDWNEIKLGDVVFNGSGVTLDQSTSSNVSGGQSTAFTVAGSVSGSAPLTVVGNVSIAGGGSIANTISGSGTLTYEAIPATTTAGFSSWTGTVNLPATTLSGFNFNNYGVMGSKVVVAGDMTGWIAADVIFAPEIQLDANLTVDDASSYPYTFTKISGSGNLSFATKTYQPSSVTINLLDGYSGTITSTLETPITILDYTSPFVPAASVTKNNMTTYYISVADAMKVAGDEAAVITLLKNTNESVALKTGQKLVTGSFNVGKVTNASAADGIEFITEDGTYEVIDNTASTWVGGSTGDWSVATNWSTGRIPSQYTAVTFGSAATVTVNGTVSIKSLVTAGSTFNGDGKFTCQTAGSISGTMKGNITVEYPAGAEPTGSTWADPAWEGTLVLNACGFVATSAAEPYPTPFHLYGSTASKIKAPGFRGYAALQDASENVCEAELVIDANTTVEFNHGTTALVDAGEDAGYFFRKLSGAGELKLDGNTDKIQYVFKNASAFTGPVTITDPSPTNFEGGKKSFVFGDSDNLDWTINDTKFPAYLVIDGDLTVAAGKTWTVPAGIVVVAGKTLTLENGSSVSLISKDSEGTVAVAAGATASIGDVEDGVITANIVIPSTGILNVSDTAVETLTLSCQNVGELDLSGCTSLVKLHLDYSDNPTFNFNGLALPDTCTTIYLDVGTKRDMTGYTLPSVTNRTVAYYAQETAAEYGGSTGVTFTNVDGSIGGITLRRFSGTIVTAGQDPSVSTQRIYTGGSQFAGAACWHEWDFEGNNGLNDTGTFSVNAEDADKLITLTANGPTYRQVEISSRPNEPKMAVSTPSQPYANVAFDDIWSAAVRCSMPTEPDKVAVAFGDTSTGVLGLANVGGGVVQLFSWTPGDEARTILAQLKVEQPSDDNNMHIYVFVVTTEDNKQYVAFYRDGEFIHKSELNFTASFTTFKVGAIAGDTVACLPGDATNGWIDYVRLYNRTIDEDTAAAISARRPFVSAKETYLREVSVGSVPEWSASGEWTLKQAGGTADCPVAGQNVTVTSPGGVGGTLDVDLSADAKYDTLIFSGSGDIVVSRGENAGKIGADMLVVRTGIDLTVAYDAVNFSDTAVNVDDGATLVFNLSNYPFEDVATTLDVQLTGVVVAHSYDTSVENRISVVGAPASGFFTVEPKWVNNCFYAMITPNYKTFTVEVPANTVVTVDGETYTPNTEISKKYGDEVTIAYAADGAFVASGTQEQIVVVGSGTGATIHAPNDYTTTAAVAQVGDDYYTTLADAVNVGGEVTLLADVTENVTVPAGKTVTLDLAGFTFSGGTAPNKPAVLNRGELTVTDSSNPSTGILKRGDITYTTGVYYVIDNFGTLVIAGGALTNASGNPNNIHQGASLVRTNKGASTTISGGTLAQNYFNVLKDEGDCTVTISGGTINCTGEYAILTYGTLVVSGGEITGPICVRGYKDNTEDVTGSATITGGDFDGPFYVEQYTGYASSATPSLAISGGTFENVAFNVGRGTKPSTFVEDPTVGTVAVIGGSFDAPVPENCCATGKIPTVISEGIYGVEDGWVITFDVEGVQTQVPTAAGATPAYDGTPAKAEDDEYTYTFAGWTPTIVEATEATTYTATFTPVAKFVTFTVVVPENTVATVTGATVVEGNTYRAAVDTEVTITYEADGAYVASGSKTQTVTPTAGEVVEAPASYEIAPAVAQVGTGYYATLAEAASSVADGGTITVLADTSTERINLEEKSFKVVLNGQTVTGTSAYGIVFNPKNGNTITIDGTAAGSTLVGTVMLTSNAQTGHIVVNGGTYRNDIYSPFYANGTCSADSTISVSGATIVATRSELATQAEAGMGVYIAGPATVDLQNVIIAAATSGVEVRAGNLTIGGENTAIVANGEFSTGKNGNGSTVTGAAIAVSPHNTNKAIALAVNGGTFTGVKAVYENYLETAARTATTTMAVTGGTFNGAVESQNVTGFISGGTFDADVPLAYCATGKVPVEVSEGGYTVVSGWVVTFVNYDDSVLEIQRVPANETPDYTGATPTKESTTQHSYEFDGWTPEVVAATATATYKATYTEIASLVTITVPEVAGAIATVTVSDGDIISSGNTYTVKPGVTVTVTWASNGAYVVTNESTSFTAEGDAIVGTDAGTLPTVTPAVAQIQGGSYYASLKAAVDAAQVGDTVTLLDNVTLDAPMDVQLGSKVVTVDLGGKTLTGRTNLKSGSLTIKNGTVAGGALQALNVYGSATAAENYSVLTIADDVTVTADVYGVCLFGPTYSAKSGYGAVINIAGTVTTTGDGRNGAVFVSGNLGNYVEGDANNIINITGSIASATDAAIALNGLATVNVAEGASVVGNTAIAVKRGTLNVTGGTVRATGDKNYGVASYGNGTEMTGAAISMTDTYNKYGPMSVAVSGGVITSDKADALFKKEGTYANGATIAVSGGSFSSDVPEAYLATGYAARYDEMSEMYVVEPGDNVAEVGEFAFETIEEAIAAVPEIGTTVKLLANVELTSTVVIDKDVTIDLNGKNIVATDARALWVKAGTVVLAGTGTISANGDGLGATSSVIRVGDGEDNTALAKLTVGEGVTVSTAKSYGISAFGKNARGIELEVFGKVLVTSTGKADAAISGNGTKGLASATITIKDGAEVSATNGAGIYFPGAGTLTVEGGSITGPTAVYVKSGNAKILGGTLTANGDAKTYKYKSNAFVATGDALVVESCGYPNGAPTASVTGGTLVSVNAKAIGCYVRNSTFTLPKNIVPAKVNGELNPARFGDANAMGIAAGYELVADGNTGLFKVSRVANDVEGTVDVVSVADTTLVAVPADCTANRLINTTNRSNGDILKVYVKSAGRYYTWELDGTAWNPVETWLVGGNPSDSTKAAAEVQLKKGEAVWVTRVDSSEPVLVNGSYEESHGTSAVTVEKGYNLVAPVPTATEAVAAEVVINEVVEKSEETVADKILVPATETSAPVALDCKVNETTGDPEWGYDYIETYVDPVTGKKRTRTVRKTTVTIPAGTGFWYINNSNTSKEIKL